jgi:hypothetical protein
MVKIKIYTHSIVDVITNSSSEIFTIETDKTKEFLVEVVNNFCKEKGIDFRVSEWSFDSLEDDWEIKNAIELLEEKGYSITRKDPAKKAYTLGIDRDEISRSLEPLKDFLISEFNAEVEYD